MTPKDDIAEARTLLNRLPCFASRRPEKMGVEPLGQGQHNRVFKIGAPGEAFVLRLGKRIKGDSGFFRREGHNLAIADKAGVGAEVVHFDAETGVLLTRFLDGVPMTKEEFADSGSVERAALALQGLHESSDFAGRFDIFERIALREKRMDESGHVFPEEAEKLRNRSLRLRQALAETMGDLVPCHNDGVPANYIDMATEMRIIDWQCAGQGDPHWELGAFMVQTGLRKPFEDIFLRAYFDGAPEPFDLARIHLYKALCAYYWMVWYFDRVVRGKGERARNWRMAEGWKAKARAALDNPDTAASLDVVREGG